LFTVRVLLLGRPTGDRRPALRVRRDQRGGCTRPYQAVLRTRSTGSSLRLTWRIPAADPRWIERL